MLIGCARVSTDDQNLELQRDALRLGDAFDVPTRAAWTKLYGATASVMSAAAARAA